ncbi:MAG: DUF3592 domain-containing protein [Clostridiales bacterium]|jgi:hypothetical protein|nr:DUF3592 domain-containing protein [Clostridiales bacterium]
MLKKPKWPLSVYFLMLGAVFIFGCVYHGWIAVDFYFIKNSAEAQATITLIEIIEKSKADEHIVHVSFLTDTGMTQTGILDTYVENMAVGDTIKIIYNKDNPSEIILSWSSPLLAVVFGAIGLLIIILTLQHLRRIRKKIQLS